MCGIAGVVSADRAALGAVAAMTGALAHRGPDDEGYLLADPRRGRSLACGGADTAPGLDLPRLPPLAPPGMSVALGHRRLAILDLSAAGHGPLPSPDGKLWITYNGEVYNYVELRSELAARGHAFRSGTDTEVLLAAYAEWGEAALSRLNGMFAFAIYDATRGVVFCARDRFGVKPFYYHAADGLVAFASEIKGLLAHPNVPRRPHEPSLAGFLVRGALDEGDQTFFDGIRALPASHHLTIDVGTGGVRLARWYDIGPTVDAAASPESFRALFEDAVRLRLRSDVDVGSCLSGGLDSSAIVAVTARLRAEGGAGRHAFSILYDDPGMSERPFVEAVVAHTNVASHTTSATAADLAEDLAALVRHQDEPIPSAGPYSQWRVMRLAREHGLKVLLDGQGADEVLAGYPYQVGPYLGEMAQRFGIRRAVHEARAVAQVTGRGFAFYGSLLAYQRLPLPPSLRRRLVGRFSTHRHVPAELLDPALLGRLGPLPGERHAPRATLREERLASVWRTSLPALLRYEDRSSMAFGIETRTPFLDYRLVEHAMALPAESLIRGGWTKAILRESMRGVLPEPVRLRRDKLGFTTPENRWMAELAPQIREWLGPQSRLGTRLAPGALSSWLRDEPAALARRPGLWRLIAAEQWLRYVEGRA